MTVEYIEVLICTSNLCVGLACGVAVMWCRPWEVACLSALFFIFISAPLIEVPDNQLSILHSCDLEEPARIVVCRSKTRHKRRRRSGRVKVYTVDFVDHTPEAVDSHFNVPFGWSYVWRKKPEWSEC